MEDNIIQNLKSKNTDLVLQSIESIRVMGNQSHFAALLELLHQTRDKLVKKKIYALFGELKSTESVPLLMEAIQDKKYKTELKDLVASCWQNGLNYSSYLPVFVDLVLLEDFPVAFEALTVIENMTGKIDPGILDAELSKVKTIPVTTDDQKQYLLDSLPTAIQSIPENQENSDYPSFS
jgi:hypothetical protein